MGVAVDVDVAIGVFVGVPVCVAVGDTVGDAVGVPVGDAVGDTVGVPVGVPVGEAVGVNVAVDVAVAVAVAVGVPAGVIEGVADGPGPACAVFAKLIASERPNKRRMTDFVSAMTNSLLRLRILDLWFKTRADRSCPTFAAFYNRALLSESLYCFGGRQPRLPEISRRSLTWRVLAPDRPRLSAAATPLRQSAGAAMPRPGRASSASGDWEPETTAR